MLDYIRANLSTLLPILLIVAVIAIIICIISRLFRIAIGVAVLTTIIPVLITIFWGDGTTYIQKFASLFNDQYQTQIEQAYDYYYQKNAEDPLVDYDRVMGLWNETTEGLREITDGVTKKITGELSDQITSVFTPPSIDEQETGQG